MTKIQLLEMLTEQARMFRADPDTFKRNAHMHKIHKAPPIDVVDAVLVGFINQIGTMQGVDYGLYAKDLKKARDNEDMVGDFLNILALKIAQGDIKCPLLQT
jgi:hypothetical protein